MFRRIFLFVIMNIAIIAMISIALSVFNVQPYLTSYGLDYQQLLIYSAIVGFTGSFFSLFLSKWMAKLAYKIEITHIPSSDREAEIIEIVKRLAHQGNITPPEVGIYDSPEINAFATGWSKNRALVAFSSGLLENMDSDEIEGVVGHEMSHILNGDMLTMTLLQGILNTFVIFLARAAAYALEAVLSKKDEESSIGGLSYYLTSMVFEILFGLIASLLLFAFSRKREYRADRSSADYLGRDKMIAALEKLSSLRERPLDHRGKSFATMKISNRPSWNKIFSTHPDLEDRIQALKKG